MSNNSLRWAIGALKDSFKVGIAKATSDYKELDISLIKATSHLESPPKEKHIQRILLATSTAQPRSDVINCIKAIGKRLSKTRNWIVALKSLVLLHRILRSGDTTFHHELRDYTRSRGRILDMCKFKDDSSPAAWDYSAWVRTYALFLDERLECVCVLKYDIEAERISGHSKLRNVDVETLLEHFQALQQLLNRMVNCQPEGASCRNALIQYALSLVIKESFKLICAVNDGIINLVDKFFDMPRHDAVKGLQIYRTAVQQAERISKFYEACQSLGLAHTFEFPNLAQPPKTFITTMEDYIKDAPRGLSLTRDLTLYHEDEIPMSPRLQITYRGEEEEEKADYASSSSRDHSIAASLPIPSPSKNELNEPMPGNHDLLDLGEMDHNAAMLEERKARALAIVPAGMSSSEIEISRNVDSVTAGWELAFVTVPSRNDGSLSDPTPAMGLGTSILDNLYEQGMRRNSNPTGYYSEGSNVSSFKHVPMPQFVQGNPFFTSNLTQQQQAYLWQQQQMLQRQQQQQQILQQQQQQQQQMLQRPFSSPYGAPYLITNPNIPHQNNPYGPPSLL